MILHLVIMINNCINMLNSFIVQGDKYSISYA